MRAVVGAAAGTLDGNGASSSAANTGDEDDNEDPDGTACTTWVTRPRSRRSRAGRRIEGNRTCRVTRRERWVALSVFNGLLLLGCWAACGGGGGGLVWVKELKMEVRRSRGEGRGDLDAGFDGILLDWNNARAGLV